MIFISLRHDRATMSSRVAIFLSLSIVFAGVSLTASVSAEGDSIIVESDMTWQQDMALSQNLIVQNGGSLTISGSQIVVEKGVNIHVESGSSLKLDNANLLAEEPPSGLVGFGYCDEGNRSEVFVPWDITVNMVEVTMRAIVPGSFDGVTAYYTTFDPIRNETVYNEESMNGEEYTFSIDEGNEGIWFQLVGPLCYPASISSVSVSTGVDAGWTDFNAADLRHRNMMVFGDAGFTFSIEGSMESADSMVMGGSISSSGSLLINDTTLDRVGPVLLTSDLASISLGGFSNFTNSTDDHDIRGMSHSSIEWGDEVSGSGGLTDKWERRISGQRLSFDAIFVTYEITGMHKFATYSNFSNEEGISFIDGGRERVVEIAWSEDNTWEEEEVWVEQAVVTITEYRTAWNSEQSGIGNYGGGQFDLGLDSEVTVGAGIPQIEWVSIMVLDENGNAIESALVGDSVAVEAVISNTGTAAANLAINCEQNSTGNTAQISPSFPGALIGPGTQSSISFDWINSVAGEDFLTCRVLTPTQLVDEFAFGGGEMSGVQVAWTEGSEDEGSSILLPVMIALVIGTAIAGYAFVANSREED